MGAHCHHPECALGQREIRGIVDRELCLAAVGIELSLACPVVQFEASGLAHARVEVFEVWDRFRDQVADAIVILDEPTPTDGVVRSENPLREPGHNRRLAVKAFVCRLHVTPRRVHDAHRVLDRDELRPVGLLVDLGAGQARQDDRPLVVEQMASVQLRADMHEHLAVLKRGRRALRIGGGLKKVSAH